MSQLEQLSFELKEKVGQFHPDLFAARTISLISELTAPWTAGSIQGLVSPMRQLLYLLNLNLTSPPRESYKNRFSEGDDRPMIEKLLQEIDIIYKTDYGEFKPFDNEYLQNLGQDEALRRRLVGVGTYNAFFHLGPLQFEEQGIEKLREIFRNFNGDLKSKLGWDTEDLFNIYDTLDKLRQSKQGEGYLKPGIPPLSQEQFMESVKASLAKGVPFDQAMREATPELSGIMAHRANPSRMHSFTRSEIPEISDHLVDLILENFTVERTINEKFLFFSQPNQLSKKPIYKTSKGEYIVIDHRMLLSAMTEFAKVECSKILKDPGRINKSRDKFLERKVENIFKTFYEGKEGVEIIPSYHLEGSERDLLILDGSTALIIECKAGNVREPAFDPDKAYERIWSDFKETIDYAYDQGYSVKEKFIEKNIFQITDNKHNCIREIDPHLYKQVFIIVVTFNKFGLVQNDLWLLLDIYEEDNEYPYAVCLDDLEMFLLALTKMSKKPQDLYQFLRKRAELHGKLNENDEGRIMGHFLQHKKFSKLGGAYRFPKNDDVIFDRLYSTGLGFANERWMDLKLNPRLKKIY
ncbi:MAG: hypothetical protein EOO46_07880 [Flavobacterium sp.]|nr:MAG: hypothetical protein EOO46_07880 [Flavobacterium sp.]